MLRDEGRSRGPIGTAFAVRDVLQTFDSLGEDLVYYYGKRRSQPSFVNCAKFLSEGISYGTVLGATLTAMFPVKVGRIVLDSVANPHEYMNDTYVHMRLTTFEGME